MWRDEIDDLDFQDELIPLPMSERPEFFSQPITAYTKNILNAVTGEDTGYRIGSANERRFYVIMERDPHKDRPREARRLFFESPEQYEALTGITVSAQSKKRFQTNQNNFKKQY